MTYSDNSSVCKHTNTQLSNLSIYTTLPTFFTPRAPALTLNRVLMTSPPRSYHSNRLNLNFPSDEFGPATFSALSSHTASYHSTSRPSKLCGSSIFPPHVSIPLILSRHPTPNRASHSTSPAASECLHARSDSQWPSSAPSASPYNSSYTHLSLSV